jgi:acyl-CoA synthetase (AMP-forming)/AMP-acid ligase II
VVDRVREARAAFDGEVSVLVFEDPQAGELLVEDVVSGSSDAPVSVDIAPEDLYAVRLTGGTTGVPKGVMMDHRCAVTMTTNMLLSLDLRGSDSFLAIHPLSHACGNFSGAFWARGSEIVVMPDFGFSPDAFVETIAARGITCTFTIPTALYRVLDAEATRDADLSSLRYVLYGAAPIAQTRLKQAIDRFGPVFVQLYGSTEAPMYHVLLTPEDHILPTDGTIPEHLRSAGRSILNTQMRIVNTEGGLCAPREVGEILARGDHTMAGYWANPELTAQRIEDGWIHTGDVGYQDEHGYLYLVDRHEDMIITGGFNVWPAEVEDVIYSHPAIAEAAVFGLPDDYWGERVTASVVLKDNAQATSDEILAYLTQRLVTYKVPKQVVVSPDPLPKSEAGKLQRRAAREQVLALQP